VDDGTSAGSLLQGRGGAQAFAARSCGGFISLTKEKERKTRREEQEQEQKLVCFWSFGRDGNGRGRCVHASGASAGPRDVAADSVSDGYR